MKRHERFEWDEDKSDTNLAKHGVSFNEAAAVLADLFFEAFHVEDYDADHSDGSEDRWLTTGSYPYDRNIILVISWTERYDDEGSVTRIIGARPVTPRERTDYEEAIRDRQPGA